METLKKVGRPKTGKKPIVNFRSNTKLTGKDVKTIIEEGKGLFVLLKEMALKTRDQKVIEYLKSHPALLEVLGKWEGSE